MTSAANTGALTPYHPTTLRIANDDEFDTESVASKSVDASVVASLLREDTIVSRWGPRAVRWLSLGTFGACLASRIFFTHEKIGQWFTSLGAGVGGCLFVEIWFKNKHAFRKIASQFGITRLFLLTQLPLYSRKINQGAIDSTIVGMFGVNLAIFSKRLYEQEVLETSQGVEEEQPGAARSEGDRFFSILPYRSFVLKDGCSISFKTLGKFALATGSGVAAGLISDDLIRPFFSFLATHYGFQWVGEKYSANLDQRIKARDRLRNSLEGDVLPRGRWCHPRTERRAATIAGVLLPPLGYASLGIIWSSSFPYVYPLLGAGTGFLQGIFDDTITRRQALPIPTQPEVTDVLYHEKEEYENSLSQNPSSHSWTQHLSYLAYGTWFAAQPIVNVALMVTFVATMFTEHKLDNALAGQELGGFLGGYLGSLLLYNIVDRKWTPNNRTRLGDSLMTSVVLSPRLLWIKPAILFFLITNLIPMTGGAVQDHTELLFLAWIAYGIAMGLEDSQTSSRRKGSDLEEYVLLLMVTALFTTINVLKP